VNLVVLILQKQNIAVMIILIIAFYNKYNYSLNIIKALLVDKNIYPEPTKIASMVKKVQRWCEAFKTK